MACFYTDLVLTQAYGRRLVFKPGARRPVAGARLVS